MKFDAFLFLMIVVAVSDLHIASLCLRSLDSLSCFFGEALSMSEGCWGKARNLMKRGEKDGRC